MIGVTFVVFVSALQLAATVNALARCLKDRFAVGWLGGIARLVLLLAGGVAGASIFFASLASPGAPAPLLPALVALVAGVLGPIISFSVLWLAHRRRVNVPLLEEERLGRPFGAWLPVALFDAAFVAANVFIHVMSGPD